MRFEYTLQPWLFGRVSNSSQNLKQDEWDSVEGVRGYIQPHDDGIVRPVLHEGSHARKDTHPVNHRPNAECKESPAPCSVSVKLFCVACVEGHGRRDGHAEGVQDEVDAHGGSTDSANAESVYSPRNRGDENGQDNDSGIGMNSVVVSNKYNRHIHIHRIHEDRSKRNY